MILRALALGIMICLTQGSGQGPGSGKAPGPAQAPGAGQARGPAPWKEYVSKEGGFKIMMPGTPKETKSKILGSNGQPIDLTMVMLDGTSHVHVVSYNDTPQPAGSAEQEKKALLIARDAIAAQFRGKILSTKDLKLNNKQGGIEIEVEIPQLTGLYRSRIFLVGKRLYHVTVIGPKDFTGSKESDAFLDSFKLTN